MPWVVDVVAGLLLAFILYALVRIRMYVAPRMRDRFGPWARWAIWVLVIATMVLVANLELMGLRQILREWFGLGSLMLHEMLFALIGFAGGLFLVMRHVNLNRQSRSTDANSDSS